MTGVVMAVTAIASAAYSAYSQREAAKADQAMADAQARQEAENAKNEGQLAGLAQVETEKEAHRRYSTLNDDIGALYAGAAGNGVLLNSGSVSSIINANVNEAKADVSSIFDQGNLKIQGHNYNANAYSTQSSLTKFAGKQAKSAGNRNAFGTLLSGAASAASSASAGSSLGSSINKRYGTSIF